MEYMASKRHDFLLQVCTIIATLKHTQALQILWPHSETDMPVQKGAPGWAVFKDDH